MKSLQDFKQRLTQSQTAARESRAEAETAQAKLTSSEASWQQQREALDKEIADLKTRYVVIARFQLSDGHSSRHRCKDLGEQNNILHQHLESVSTHAARIKQAASSASTESGVAESTDDDTKLTELRSLVTYLRKEKEIIELQLELGKQENTRFKTQVDHLSRNLEEARQALSEVRSYLSINLAITHEFYRNANVLLRRPLPRSNTASWPRRSTRLRSSGRATQRFAMTATNT